MLRLIDPSPLPDDASIERFNSYFDYKVPPAMLEFYRRANGGYLRDEDEDTDPSGVAYLIPLGDDCTCMEALHRDYVGGFPHLAQYVPFAADSFGNCYLLSLRDEDHGRVYLHLLDDEGLLLIEDSFEELMAGIEFRQRAGDLGCSGIQS